MGDKTKIQWTDASWNPIAAYYEGKRGWMCSKPSPGCRSCYSEKLNLRLGNGLLYTPENVKKVEWQVVNLDKPSEWKRPRMIFVESMGDFFHEALHDEMIGRIWSKMLECPQHIFQVLTKRADRMLDLVTKFNEEGARKGLREPSHIWLGVSVEDRKFGLPRIETLKKVPAKIRFLSVEPQIEYLGGVNLEGVQWVVCGGESGADARGFSPDWARSLGRQCEAQGVAFFMKQMGSEWAKRNNAKDSKGGEMSEWPEDLRVRQMPQLT